MTNEPEIKPALGKWQTSESGILDAIGCVRFEKLKNGRFVVCYPVMGGDLFPSDQEQEARERFQSVARYEKGYPSGFDPCAVPAARGQPEAFSARVVRKMVKDDIPLSDFLGCCVIEIPKLLAWIDGADAGEQEKNRVKQKLLHWQAKQRLEPRK